MEILQGTRILCHMLHPERVLIGIEDNKPEAIAALKAAISAEISDGVRFELRVIPTKYPSGGAKQLTKILTGLEVPKGHHSSSIGVLMQNVGTVFAIKRAIIDGEPLIERVVTLTGEAMAKPGNVWARLGTPIEHLMQEGQLQPQGDKKMVIMGGPLMGFTLPSLNVPVVKISNCLLAPSDAELGQPEPEEACIRCSLCAESCPAGLLPQQLYWFSKGEEHEKARKHNLFDCIECGACAYVCPSNIPLVQYYRQEKAEIRAIDAETARATEAKARFEAKQARMEREKLAREEKHQKAAVKLDDVAAKEVPVAEKATEQQAEADPRKAALAAAIARAKAKKAAAEQEIPVASEPVPETPPSAEDDRKAAVAAAIARVKAKKAGNNGVVVEAKESELNVAPQPSADDDRKAAVAAAIARVKAKKAAAAQPAGSEGNVTASPAEPSADDKRKAAVAAAIARAKAKKAAALSEAQDAEPEEKETSQQESDPRKAAVAAAIARVKARKAAQTMSNEE